jgi:hypothetical protein
VDNNVTDRATLLITVTAATVAFGLAFNVGAFDTVFFDVYLSVWVVATAVLVGSLVSELPPRDWWGRLLLLLPTAWIVAAWIGGPADADTGADVLFVLTIVVTVISLPFVAWVLVSVINPDFVELPGRNRVAVLAGVLVFALVGYGLGARNDIFLNCDDFKVSGNDLPANCVSGPNTPNPGGSP